MKRKFLLFAVVVAALVLAGCSEDETENPSVGEQVDELIESMSLRQLVCQMFVVRPEALSSNPTEDGMTVLTEDMKAFYDEYPVGGVCLYAKNIVSPSQLTAFTQDIHTLPMRPLLYVDEEGRLWVGTNDDGVTMVSGLTNTRVWQQLLLQAIPTMRTMLHSTSEAMCAGMVLI